MTYFFVLLTFSAKKAYYIRDFCASRVLHTLRHIVYVHIKIFLRYSAYG